MRTGRRGALEALVVSYAFPPVGGAGVQRVAKLVKYLPHHGVSPSVLSATTSSVPLTDRSLAAELPAELDVRRVPTLEPSYSVKAAVWKASSAESRHNSPLRAAMASVAKSLLVPDPQVLWQPAAAAALARRLIDNPPDVLFISGPPFSQFLLAPLARLSRRTAVVLDYRDEWSTYRSTYEMTNPSLQGAVGHLERLLLRSAHAVTTATEAFRTELCRRFPFLDPDSVHAIPNGYDPTDFPVPLPSPPKERLVLTYAGTIFKLTSVGGLLRAVRKLARRMPDLGKRLELRFIGRIVDTERHHFDGMDALGVRRDPYMDHGKVLEELAKSHVVLCVLDDVPGAERIYPAKIFELMHLGRHALVLAPEGALAELCKQHHFGEHRLPRDEDGIAEVLESLLVDFESGCPPRTATPIGIEQYSRRALAGRFAEVFSSAARSARARGSGQWIQHGPGYHAIP